MLSPRIQINRMSEDVTALEIALIRCDGDPKIVVNDQVDSEPVSWALHPRTNVKTRIRPSHPYLDFEETVAYWSLFLLGQSTAVEFMDRAV